MFSRFFIHRPVFAWVISIVIMLTGALAISSLPIAQYPDVAPPLCLLKRPIPVLLPRRWKTA